MIHNETPLEQLFNDMLDEMTKDMYGEEDYTTPNPMLDILKHQSKKGNHIDLAMDINLNEVYRFMHYMPDADNPEHTCQFVLGENNYYDNDKDDYLPLTKEHQRDFQRFCDLYAKNGFKFKVTLNPMSLLWTKDGKVINGDNFDTINSALEKSAS